MSMYTFYMLLDDLYYSLPGSARMWCFRRIVLPLNSFHQQLVSQIRRLPQLHGAFQLGITTMEVRTIIGMNYLTAWSSAMEPCQRLNAAS